MITARVKHLLILMGLLVLLISIPLTVYSVRQQQIYLSQAASLGIKRMCDWDCTLGGRLVLYSRLVEKTEVCPKKITVTIGGKKRQCTFLGSFLRKGEEIAKMCQKDWVVCK